MNEQPALNHGTPDDDANRISRFEFRLTAVESRIAALSVGHPDDDRDVWMTAEEFAKSIRRSVHTVRRWCREQRVHAEKTACGRGGVGEWRVSVAELQRYQREGLLPSNCGSMAQTES